MANRFPLIVDATTSQIKEIPIGDSLDFTSVGIANLSSLSVGGSFSAATISSSGNATVGGTLEITGNTTAANITSSGTVDATTFTVGGQALSTIQVQSDWNVSDTGSAAFIKNKPSLVTTINRLDEITDVDAYSAADDGKVLTFNGTGWQALAPTGGISLLDLDAAVGTASGQGSLDYNNLSGVFTYNPPTASGIGAATAAQGVLADNAVQPGDNISELINDESYTTFSDIGVSAPIVKTPTSGNGFTLSFDNTSTGFLTAESDTFATVTGRGALTTEDITVNSITATDNTTDSVFQNVEVLGLTVNASGITSTNGDIAFTNGNITATNGTITGATVTGTNSVTTSGLMDTPLLRNSSGDLTLQSNSGGRIQITQGTFKLVTGESRPTGELGDLYHTGTGIEMYLSDTGGGSAGWIHVAGSATNASHGLLIPVFTTTERNALSASPGETILNTTTGKLEVWDGVSSWIVVGP